LGSAHIRGEERPWPISYCASKVFAEKAAFEYVEKNKPNFTVLTICPPMVFGPNEHHIDKLSNLVKHADLRVLVIVLRDVRKESLECSIKFRRGNVNLM
jgi:nucleoside-diphosphate-sugar epimerase